VGQKIHPIGFRVGITRPWISRWYADKKNFGHYLVEDERLRKAVKDRLKGAGIAKVEIERTGDEVRLLLFTSRPGIVIGRKGSEVDKLREQLESIANGKRLTINIREVTNADINAQLVAEAIAEQLVKRASYRRAMKKAIDMAMQAGVKGIKITCGGRLAGAEIARSERYVVGSLPLHTLDMNIDYGFAEAQTTYGQIGIKVWINLGPVEKPAKKK
jgi:small subunit ribosomal protein S3